MADKSWPGEGLATDIVDHATLTQVVTWLKAYMGDGWAAASPICLCMSHSSLTLSRSHLASTSYSSIHRMSGGVGCDVLASLSGLPVDRVERLALTGAKV